VTIQEKILVEISKKQIAAARIPIQKSKKHNGCNGKCGHAMCSVPLNIGIVSFIPLD
jgi:hypothetical protein